MKRYYWVLVMIGISCMGMSGDDNSSIHFIKRNWSYAQNVARRSHKPMFVYVTSKVCTVCRKMERNTFANQEVQDFFNEYYINYEAETDNMVDNVRAADWGILQVPALVFLDHKNNVVKIVRGYTDPEAIINEAQSALIKANFAARE